MVLLEVAAYILFVMFAVFVSARILWLVFLLFCYRFWESLLPRAHAVEIAGFLDGAGYYVLLAVLAVGTYTAVVRLTQEVQHIRYLILLAMVLYTTYMHQFEISNILLFKDYLEENGMWELGYWKEQVIELLSFSMDDLIGWVRTGGEKIASGIEWLLSLGKEAEKP